MNQTETAPVTASIDSPAESASMPSSSVKPLFSAPRADWKRALLFLLSMSLLGLSFYPILAIIMLLMINSWRNAREHFLIQLFILGGGYGLFYVDQLPVHISDIIQMLSILAIFIVRKDRVTRRVVWAVVGYVVMMILMATMGLETMRIQLYGIRTYAMVVCFMMPLLVFSNVSFDMAGFIRTVIVYSLIICAFYALDGFVFQGWILMPRTFSNYDPSTFWAPIWRPLSTYFPRKYPPGLMWLALCVYPLIYIYRFSWKQWAIVVVAFAAARTMTVISGLLTAYVLFQRNIRKVLVFVAGAIIVISGLYVVDSALGSPMRIASTVEQFASLDTVKDDEDLAEFGTQRMAQVIPKMELLYERGRQWIGFGFIHPELSKNNAVQLTNNLYTDVEYSEENVSKVEVSQIHTILMMGYIGLILQTAFYIILYFILKPTGWAKYYLSTVVAYSIFGIGGFGGLTQYPTLLLVALTIGVALMSYRQKLRDAEKGIGERE